MQTVGAIPQSRRHQWHQCRFQTFMAKFMNCIGIRDVFALTYTTATLFMMSELFKWNDIEPDTGVGHPWVPAGIPVGIPAGNGSGCTRTRFPRLFRGCGYEVCSSHYLRVLFTGLCRHPWMAVVRIYYRRKSIYCMYTTTLWSRTLFGDLSEAERGRRCLNNAIARLCALQVQSNVHGHAPGATRKASGSTEHMLSKYRNENGLFRECCSKTHPFCHSTDIVILLR